jgi:hypothetical protein
MWSHCGSKFTGGGDGRFLAVGLYGKITTLDASGHIGKDWENNIVPYFRIHFGG